METKEYKPKHNFKRWCPTWKKKTIFTTPNYMAIVDTHKEKCQNNNQTKH